VTVSRPVWHVDSAGKDWFYLNGHSASEGTPEEKKSYYKFIAWVYPIGRTFYPAGFCTLQEVGLAMINAVRNGYPRQIVEVKDIVELAKQA
jgi:hypothetical protein